jgi:hypothetical protein
MDEGCIWYERGDEAGRNYGNDEEERMETRQDVFRPCIENRASGGTEICHYTFLFGHE